MINIDTYKYNQRLRCSTDFGTIVGKFLCYRPDKNTVIIDYNDRVHEFEYDKVSYMKYNEVIEYYESLIEVTKLSIEQAINLKRDCENGIIKNEQKLLNYKNELSLLKEKLQSLKVAGALADNELSSEKDKCTQDIKTCEYNIGRADNLIFQYNFEIKRAERYGNEKQNELTRLEKNKLEYERTFKYED